MAKRPVPATTEPITRDDLQRRFQTFQDGVRGELTERKNTLVTAAGAAGLVVVLIVFLLGRRSGKKKTTYVEIRRV